jgi:2-hydroxy-3-oxopropionate reductase
MALNLLKSGFPLVVYNRTKSKTEALTEAGAELAESPAEVAQKADVIITMVNDSSDVEEVVLGKKGVAEGTREGSVLIDMSSISPVVSKRIAEQLRKQGVQMLDAPVSGGEQGAKDATLAIMVGGEDSVYRDCLPILKAMGKSVVLMGPNGAGQIAKLANQVIAAINIEALGEAFTLATKAGIDPHLLFEAIRGGLAGSNIMNSKIPIILDRNFKPGFKLALHQKDLKNALETARELSVPLPLTSLVQQMLIHLTGAGKGDLDHSAIINFVEELANVEIKRTPAIGSSH